MLWARKIVLCLIDSAGIFRVAVLDGQHDGRRRNY